MYGLLDSLDGISIFHLTTLTRRSNLSDHGKLRNESRYLPFAEVLFLETSAEYKRYIEAEKEVCMSYLTLFMRSV